VRLGVNVLFIRLGIVIGGPRIVLARTDAVCVHALSTLLHYVVALDEGVDPVKLGLSKPEDKEHAYFPFIWASKFAYLFGFLKNYAQLFREVDLFGTDGVINIDLQVYC
jgi:hypothetical protein